MAKTKPEELLNGELYEKPSGEMLRCLSTFVSEIEIYHVCPERYHLVDSTLKTSKTFTTLGDVEYKKEGSKTIITTTRLMGAPLKWLLENNYKLI